MAPLTHHRCVSRPGAAWQDKPFTGGDRLIQSAISCMAKQNQKGEIPWQA